MFNSTINNCICDFNTTQNDCPLELAPKVSTQSTRACFRLGQHHVSTACCRFKTVHLQITLKPHITTLNFELLPIIWFLYLYSLYLALFVLDIALVCVHVFYSSTHCT